MVKFRGLAVFMFVLSLSLVVVSAADYTKVIANSENWEDVYSVMLYSSLTEISGNFLTSTSHASTLLSGLSTSNNLLLVTSEEEPFVSNLEAQAWSYDFDDVSEVDVDSANLELIDFDELDDIENFIIVSNNYGYNAIAVTPYAVLTNSWVFLADKSNADDIESILSKKNPDSVILYGYMDSEISETFESYDPTVINNNNRFEDNIEIVEIYKEINDEKQVLLSNGGFIESEIMSGEHPILFTGTDTVPEQIAEYLKSSNIEVGVLIGNELINAATNIREDTGLSVMVKFAQGARGQTSGISAVEGLDLFYVPTPSLNLEVYSVKYNRASSEISVTYHSDSNVPIYIMGTLDVDGDDDWAGGDDESVFIAPNDYKTLTYEDVSLDGEDFTISAYTLFGETDGSFDYVLSGTYNLSIVNIIDDCDVEIKKVVYNKQSESFYVYVKNLDNIDCYVDVELQDIEINGAEQTIGTEGSALVEGKDLEKIEIEESMTHDDLEENEYVTAVAYFGEKEDALVNSFKGEFKLRSQIFSGTTMAIIILIILILIIIFFIWKRKKEEDDW